ncbi:MAG: neutral/alkaline non-lysosomal ceramidase N-terminal domain-containing protein [Candidatus Hydrogenedentes bacterium]|nr:neutral/alkaline non-lysosomal ceramidase N-terminal domain-containing protein [Candidatus Hydrogenedentota bacterium]
MLKKIVVIAVLLLVNLAAVFITVIGPWPTYGPSDVESEGYYRTAIAAIDECAAERQVSERPGPLRAGWAAASITPGVGTPLAGFGSRKGRPSTGVHDGLDIRAVAFSDADDVVVIAGSDLLIVPENVAELAREKVAARVPLSPRNLLFNASHTHAGPGAWGPGLVAKEFSGTYDPAVVELLAEGFSNAIVGAYNAMAPAALAHGGVDAPDYIRNRTRDACTDSELGYLVVRRDDGQRCYIVRYSAHATVTGSGNMEFSAGYPGCLRRAIEEETGAFAVFLGGAVGSMSARPGDGADGFARAERMGAALGRMVVEHARDERLDFQREVDVATVGVPIDLPPFQLRLNRSWRVSPFLLPVSGIDGDGWIHGARLGEVFLYGVPCDFSGEISVDLRQSVAARGLDLWVTSFNGDYGGYVSPDRYYATADQDKQVYEMYTMSWLGPNQEALFTGLLEHLVDTMAPGAAPAS